MERENNAKLETVNTKLRQAKQAAEDAFQVAQEANRSKSSFLANMSHDIRTPVSYTHLDVYKRQVSRYLPISKARRKR